VSVQPVTLTRAAIGVAVADQPEDLAAFLKPGCAAAIWRRRPLPDFQAWIDGLSADLLPRGRAILPADAVAETAGAFCDMAGTPPGPQRNRLVEDVSALAWIFASVMQSSHVRLHMKTETDDAHRSFHIDAVAARLVCTYRGHGTQYGISADGREPRRVFIVPTGAPILLRGTLWPDSLWPDSLGPGSLGPGSLGPGSLGPGSPGPASLSSGQPPSGLLHRAPSARDPGDTRLVLTLDPVFDPEDEK